MSQTTGHRDLRQNNKKKVGFQEPTHPSGGEAVASLTARLTALGVDAGHAAKLAFDHPPQRIADALDAAEVERPRSPAGWVVAAIRNGWDVRSPAEQHRAERARRRRREQRQADRRQAQRHTDDQARRADAWADAVSDALDDRQLAAAIDRVTQPLPKVGRRPVPMVRVQLITWAAALHATAPSQPLSAVLAVALATPAGDDPAPHSGDLPTPPPPSRGDPPPLDRRIAACLHDLDQHPSPNPDKEQL